MSETMSSMDKAVYYCNLAELIGAYHKKNNNTMGDIKTVVDKIAYTPVDRIFAEICSLNAAVSEALDAYKNNLKTQVEALLNFKKKDGEAAVASKCNEALTALESTHSIEFSYIVPDRGGNENFSKQLADQFQITAKEIGVNRKNFIDSVAEAYGKLSNVDAAFHSNQKSLCAKVEAICNETVKKLNIISGTNVDEVMTALQKHEEEMQSAMASFNADLSGVKTDSPMEA